MQRLVPERQLWVAVIGQAIADATQKRNLSSKKEIETFNANRSQAVDWLRLGNQDFQEVCDIANLNPKWVIRKYLENGGNEAREIQKKKTKEWYKKKLKEKKYV